MQCGKWTVTPWWIQPQEVSEVVGKNQGIPSSSGGLKMAGDDDEINKDLYKYKILLIAWLVDKNMTDRCLKKLKSFLPKTSSIIQNYTISIIMQNIT